MKTRQIDFNRDLSDDKRSVRRLIVALAAVLALGVMVFGVVFAINDFSFEKLLGAETTTADPSAESETDPAATAPLFTDENAINVMLLGYNEKDITFCSLISFSAAENSIKVKPVSPDLTVEFGGKSERVSDIFYTFGAAEVAQALGDKYAPVHRWVSVSDAKLRSLLQKLGNVMVYIPNDIDVSVDAIRYQYARGTRELTGDALINLMKYAYSGEDALSFQAQAVAGALRTHLTAETLARGEEFFSELINMVDGNINAFDYAEILPRLTSFVEGAPEITVTG